MTNIRIEKDRDEWRRCGWTSVPNLLLLDKHIRWECKGAFGWMSLAADDPEFDLDAHGLANAGPRGRDHAQDMIRELEKFGWITRRRQACTDGTPEIVYRLHTRPVPESERTFTASTAKAKKRKFPQVKPQKLTGQAVATDQGVVDNSTAPDSAEFEHSDVSAGQTPKTDRSGPGRSGPGRSGRLTTSSRKTSSSSLGSSTAVDDVVEDVEEEEVELEEERGSEAGALLSEYARFKPGRWMSVEALAECVRLIDERLEAGWERATLARYVREWSAQAHNPTTYLPRVIGELDVQPPAARRAVTQRLAREAEPAAPASSEEVRAAAREEFAANRRPKRRGRTDRTGATSGTSDRRRDPQRALDGLSELMNRTTTAP